MMGVSCSRCTGWLVFLIGYAAGVAALKAEEQAQTRPARPANVLLIMTDQQTAGALGCAANPLIKTPNLDRLAGQGVRITQAVCATPFCTPTRASIRTGQWPHTHGLVSNVAPDHRIARRQRNQARDRGRQEGITDKQITLDNLLFDHAYQLQHLGKWHLGDLSGLRCYREKADEEPDRLAYNKWREQLGDSVVSKEARPGEVFVPANGGVFVAEAMARKGADLEDDEGAGKREPNAVGRSAVAPRAQFETWLADRAIAWLDQHADKPFMLTYSVVPPHAPWIAPDPYYSIYDPAKMILPASFGDRPAVYRTSRAAQMGAAVGEAGLREYLRCYCAQVTMVDEQIGRLLGKLRELGLERDTLVIFTSDHGDMQAAHGMMGKSVHGFYEEDVRVPLIFRYPPTIRGGQVLDLCANSVDLMPTVLDYAGLPVPPSVQGRSLRPFLDGTAQPDDQPGFCERGLSGKTALRMIRTKEWKYCVYGDGRRELFDLTKDPGETRNLADATALRAQRQDLERQLRDWMRRTADPALDHLFPRGQ